MGKENNMDKNEKEVLAEEVRKYPCLYDGSDPYFRDIKKKDHAWKLVTVALGYEEGEAFKQFDLLRERYSKKQIEWSKSNTSSGTDTSEEQEKDYKFLTWLQPHIKLASGDDVVDLLPEEDDIDDNNVDDDDDDYEDDEDDDEDDDDSNDTLCYDPIGDRKLFDTPLNTDISTSQDTSNKRKYLWETQNIPHHKRQAIAAFQNGGFLAYNNMRHPMITDNNQDEIFGHMIAAELKTLPPHIKVQVKYDIQNVLYRHQMLQLQQMHSGHLGGYPQYPQQQTRIPVASHPPPTKSTSIPQKSRTSDVSLNSEKNEVPFIKNIKQEPIL